MSIIPESDVDLREKIHHLELQIGQLLEHQKSVESTCSLKHKHEDFTLTSLATRIKNLEDEQDQTGKHEISKLQKALEARDASATYWNRYVITTAISIVLMVLSGLWAMYERGVNSTKSTPATNAPSLR